MKRLVLFLFALCPSLFAQKDGIQTKTTYAKAYGETKNAVAVDPVKDLPRYPAVEPKDAIGTWQVKKGFKLQLAAHEPQVRDPIAICFDERGRMFVCEMIDYSEMRDVTPHLGRISMLQDKGGDGYYETSQVFADDLPWPTGSFGRMAACLPVPRRTSGDLRTRTTTARPRCARKSSPASAPG